MTAKLQIDFDRDANCLKRFTETVDKLRSFDEMKFLSMKTDAWIIPYNDAILARDFILTFCQMNAKFIKWVKQLKFGDYDSERARERIKEMCKNIEHKYDLTQISKLALLTGDSDATFMNKGYANIYFMIGLIEGLFNNVKEYAASIEPTFRIINIECAEKDSYLEKYFLIVKYVERLYDKLCYIEYFLSKKLK